jgi:hypothetical protein
MIQEDVLDFDGAVQGCTANRRNRALREALVRRAATSTTISKIEGDHRGRRALRKTRRLAPRARHLRYNHFTRPPRRRRLNECSSTELLDGLSIKGGYDGTMIFFKLELDVSKQGIEDPRELILKPLRLLSETSFLQDLNLFSEGETMVDSIFDEIDADISFSSGAHLGATGKQIPYAINIVDT